MPEELQRFQLQIGSQIVYQGSPLGPFQHYIIGSTTLSQLKSANIIAGFVTDISFKANTWSGNPSQSSKPDEIILDGTTVVAVVERKDSIDLKTPRQEEAAAEQCLTYMQQLGAKIGIITDYQKYIWIHNMGKDITELRYISENSTLISFDYRQPGVIQDVLDRLDPLTDFLIVPVAVDPSDLADKVWQSIWMATHEEPKLCLSTFVELFLFKFLSDLQLLPTSMSIDQLNTEESAFVSQYGSTQIEFYVDRIRPRMKQLFPAIQNIQYPNNILKGSEVTSVINGFAFLDPSIIRQVGQQTVQIKTYNGTFIKILDSFVKFGRVNRVESEFKSRVYEKFLKKTVKQQKLGQYLTPRNVVRAVVGMSNAGSLMARDDAIICDPASGVGGFLLEPLLYREYLANNLQINGNRVSFKVKLLGLELDPQTNILSKANMLIHLAEKYIAMNDQQKTAFIRLMHETFILVDNERILGTLRFPQDSAFDLVLTNPPFVVSGTSVVKEKIAENTTLAQRYSGAGTGIESLFIRWIIDSLKPGGRAFVIVPTGILTRSETSVRQYILDKCILDGVVLLPERTFYNTPNRTYILTFTKKIDINDIQPDYIFAFVVREVGETRDARRFRCRSDLPDLIRQFRAYYADRSYFEPRNLNCKLIPKDNLTAAARWDIDRFWTDDEIRKLGLSEPDTMSVDEFRSGIDSMYESVATEVDSLRQVDLSQIKYVEISLSDTNYFKIEHGNRITRKDINQNPGDIPVISGHGEQDSYLGKISAAWLSSNGTPVMGATDSIITVNANGNVGATFLRNEEKFVVHDDVNIVKLQDARLHPQYVVYAIREAVAKSRSRYDAKLYAKRLKQLVVRVPVDQNGSIDSDQQKALAEELEKLEELKRAVLAFSKELEDKFITAEFGGSSESREGPLDAITEPRAGPGPHDE